MQNTPEIVVFIIQGLMALVVFFGGMWVRDLAQSVKELRIEDQKLADRIVASGQNITDKLSGYVQKDEFRDFRSEQRELFGQLFDRLDAMRNDIAKKADR